MINQYKHLFLLAIGCSLVLCYWEFLVASAHSGQKVEWYDGEEAPSVFTGYLTLTKGGYLFTEIDPIQMTSTKYLVKFYDEDAEAEAIEIAKENKEKPMNIELLGYPKRDDSNILTLEVIYGIDPHKKEN